LLLGNFFEGNYFAEELFHRGTISPGSFFARELFRGNSFEGTLSRELFERSLSKECFPGNFFAGYFFKRNCVLLDTEKTAKKMKEVKTF
jgi:hypothetical protein